MAKWRAYGLIDSRVQAACEYLLAHQPNHEVEEAVGLVRVGIPGTRLRGFDGVFQMMRRASKEWAAEIEKCVIEYVKKRVREYHRQTEVYVFHGERVEVRKFENYRDTEGKHRWQPVRAMTANELATCIVERRERIAAEELRIDVYEALLDELRKASPTAKVEEVFDKVLAAAAPSN